MSKYLRVVAAVCLLTTPAFAGVKENQHQQLSDLAAEMHALRTAGDMNGYAALSAQYDQLSAALGGARPGWSLPGDDSETESPEVPEGGMGLVPTAPPGCTSLTTLFNNTTPVIIPAAGANTVTSTVVVAGLGNFLWDVNLRTFITHSFNSDLDISLTSPAGTIVSLTTNSGGVNDNVFNGTIWDDQANPGGPVPYTNNPGVTSDRLYANNVLASPLVPEEAMGAFIGENPNGTWTVTIADEANLDGGELNNWTLELTALPVAPTIANTTSTNNTPVVIPAAGANTVTSQIVIAGAGPSIVDLNLTAFIVHSFNSDLDIALTSPVGTIVTLTTNSGGVNDNVFNGTLWDDQANLGGPVPYTNNVGVTSDRLYANNVVATPMVPEEAMGAFAGEDPNGTWTLTIADEANLDGGSLNSWTLDIDTGTCAAPCQITCPANVTQANDPNQCGAVVNYPPPTILGQCGVVTCSPASGSFFPVGTTTITCSEQIPALGEESCTFTTTVNDTQPPAIDPLPSAQAGTEAPACTAVINFNTPITSDNCPGVSAVCAPPSGSTFPLGATTVTCTSTDASGNTATTSAPMTVVDDDAPAITCPANIEEDLPPGETEGTASWPDPLVSDNCPNVGAPSCVPPSGSTFQADVLTPVVCDVTDGAGNPASCTFTVLLGLVSILEIPTASSWGLAALALLLVGAALLVMRRNG